MNYLGYSIIDLRQLFSWSEMAGCVAFGDHVTYFRDRICHFRRLCPGQHPQPISVIIRVFAQVGTIKNFLPQVEHFGNIFVQAKWTEKNSLKTKRNNDKFV